MAQGADIYLNEILTKIYANHNLCKLLYFDDRNPLSHSNLSDTTILKTDKLNQRLFISPFSIDTTDKTKSTLHIMINNFEFDTETKYYSDFEIDFIICINVRIWEIDDGSELVQTRLNLIIDELLKTFNRQRTIGMGKNHFQYGKIQKYSDYFWGMIISLRAIDLPTYLNE